MEAARGPQVLLAGPWLANCEWGGKGVEIGVEIVGMLCGRSTNASSSTGATAPRLMKEAHHRVGCL